MLHATNLIDWFALFALVAALIAAALSDVASYLIPNRYSAAVIAAFLVYAIGKPIPFALAGSGAAALLFAAGTVLFAFRALGGGDVKLLTACGFWAGFDQLPLLLLGTAVAGGVLALVHLSPLRRLMPAAPGAVTTPDLRGRLRQPIPFGAAIAVAGICVGLARLSAL